MTTTDRTPVLTIGQASQRSGASPKAIRLYESRGLLPRTQRSALGHRLFTQDDVELLHFVTQAKAAGLRLEDVKAVLDLQRDGHAPCVRVRAALDERIQEVERVLGELGALRDRMRQLRDGAKSGQEPESGFCPIITDAAGGAHRRTGAPYSE